MSTGYNRTPRKTKEYLDYLGDQFRYALDRNAPSINKGLVAYKYYNDKPYTDDILQTLEARNQPAEQYNIIKIAMHTLVGNLSGIASTIRVSPVQNEDVDKASMLNALLRDTLESNSFITESIKMHKDGLLTGLICAHVGATTTGEVDSYGVPTHTIFINHVPSSRVILDPSSELDDYSDARYIHYYKWVKKVELLERFGSSQVIKDAIPEDRTIFNGLTGAGTIYTETDRFAVDTVSIPEDELNYLLIHSVIKDQMYDNSGTTKNPDTHSIYWMPNGILSVKNIKYSNVKFPYIIQKVNPSSGFGYSGIFEGVLGTQDSTNIGLLKAGNTNNIERLLVTGIANAEEMRAIEKDWNNGVPIISLPSGATITPMENTTERKLAIVNSGIERAHAILGITPELQGISAASSSGRKVQIQQNAARIGQWVITSYFVGFYSRLGKELVKLYRQYYTAQQAIDVSSDRSKKRLMELNTPEYRWDGQSYTESGTPKIEVEMVLALDPETNEPLENQGEYIWKPKIDPRTSLDFTMKDITVSPAPGDEDDVIARTAFSEFQQVLMPILMQAFPIEALDIIGKHFRGMESEIAQDISDILLEKTAEMRQASMDQGQVEGGGEDMDRPKDAKQQPSPQQQANSEVQKEYQPRKSLLGG